MRDWPCPDQTNLSLPKIPPSQSGLSLLYVIALVAVLAALAAGIAALSPGAALTNATQNGEQRAYYLALSGLNFWSVGRTGTFAIDGDAFTLTQTGPDASGTYTVTSVGHARIDTGLEANVLLTERRFSLGPITFDNDLRDFSSPVIGRTSNNARAIVIFDADLSAVPDGYSRREWRRDWRENASRYAGGWMRFGDGRDNTHAATWYTGDHGACPGGDCPDGMCRDGRCAFGKGLRAYFQFSFFNADESSDSTARADGFTFAVMTADNDPRTAAGGPPSGTSRGEYLGYAGPGPSGRGIRPPKMAVEVDVFPNRGDDEPTEVHSRRDHTTANHVAVVWWGADDWWDASRASYDDNVHGAGGADDWPASPRNSAGGDPGYHQVARISGRPNWLEDGGEHAMRVEIARETESSGRGAYTVKVWVDPASPDAADVTRDFDAETPLAVQSVSLAAGDHNRLSDVYFGFTEGTGGSNQTVAVHDFALDFRR